jgi:hypothetical protein
VYVGFWRCHPEAWCVTEIQLGNLVYTADQANTILHEDNHHNGLIMLAKVLITTKLNIECNHSETSCIQQTVNDSDTLIGNLVIPPFGNGYLPLNAVGNLVTVFNHYNMGRWCAPGCVDPPCNPAPTATPTPYPLHLQHHLFQQQRQVRPQH